MSLTAGAEAARAWLTARTLSAPATGRWDASALLAPGDLAPRAPFDDTIDTRFRIEIYSDEWGVFFCHMGRASWVRVTDVAFVHGRDDFGLLPLLPALGDVGQLLRRIEQDQHVHFRRDLALVRTSMARAEPLVRRWVEAL